MARKRARIFGLVIFFVTFTAVAVDTEVRKVTPPKLEPSHLGEEVYCYRPMRRDSPNMSIEKKEGKIIAHNYGHGGSGWTLGPGAAAYVNDLLLRSSDAASLQKETPITIIGAGVLGLFTAYDLSQRGFKNISIVAETFHGLTSYKAGGLWAPFSLDVIPAFQRILEGIGIKSYQFYLSIAQKKNQDFQDGANVVPAYFVTREESGLEPYVGKVIKPAKDVILDFSNGTKRKMVAYDDGIFMDTDKMMTNLSSYMKKKGIEMIQAKVNFFGELKSQYIINCSGLGAAELNKDSKMVSAQGHLRMLKDQNPQDLQYILSIFVGEGKTETGQKVKRYFYIHPKHKLDSGINDIGVMGGTVIEGATPDTPNGEEFDIMLQEAKKFYGITK